MQGPNEHESATYHGVALLKPGSYRDLAGRPVELTAADLAGVAERYDPRFHAAPVNIDHREEGPALGLVSDLIWDGEHLLADLSAVPREIAALIDAGRYPFRSAELYLDLEGRGPYLRALALLGAKPPAVKGLPPMPPREANTAQAMAAKEPERGYSLLPWAGAHLKTQSADAAQAKARPRTIHITSEVHMAEQQDETTAPAAEQPQAAEDTVRLAEENRRLAEENRKLKRTESEREVALFLSGLRQQGKLTPAMERAGIAEALLLAEERQLAIALSDGQEMPLGEVLRAVLAALPVSFDTAELAAGEQAEPALSFEEREIARQLGLSEDEYVEIRQGA